MPLLQEKVAIVTGASSGIGRAAALRFATAGASVVVGARRRQELDALAAEIEAAGGAAAAVTGDVRDPAFADALVSAAVERFGGLDIAFNNAGTLGPAGPTDTIDPADWEDAIAVNLTGAFLAARCGGAMIFTSTFVGHTVGFPGVASYAAGKSGLIGLVQALAAELGPANIRVNAILPGAVDTAMFHGMNDTAEARAFITGLHALKRIATPDEIAGAALYLASGLASFQTGTAMLVDGGVSINRT